MRGRGYDQPRVRGQYHQLLNALLCKASKDGLFTQESLATELQKEQTTVGKYLRNMPVSGTLDLDEAHAALVHVGSTLKDFINAPEHVVPRVDLPVFVQRLMKDESFVTLVTALADAPTVPRQRALRHLAGLAAELVPRRRAGSSGGRGSGGRRTTKAPKPRR